MVLQMEPQTELLKTIPIIIFQTAAPKMALTAALAILPMGLQETAQPLIIAAKTIVAKMEALQATLALKLIQQIAQTARTILTLTIVLEITVLQARIRHRSQTILPIIQVIIPLILAQIRPGIAIHP
jgi:hypothetical protein